MNAAKPAAPMQLPEDPVDRLEAVCLLAGLGKGWRNKAGAKIGVSKAMVYNWADRTYAPPADLDELLLRLIEDTQEAVAEVAGQRLSKLAAAGAALGKRAGGRAS